MFLPYNEEYDKLECAITPFDHDYESLMENDEFYSINGF